MTREEAIDIIKCLAWHTRPNEEDIEQAIKALSQEPMREFTEEEAKAYSKALDKMYKPTGFNVFKEPCADAVSREDAYGCLTFNGHYDTLNEVYERISKLPSVTPTQKNTLENTLENTLGDAISREAVLKGIEELKKSPWATDKRGNGFEYLIAEALDVVADLCVKQAPPVTQKSDNKYRKEAKRWKRKWLKAQKSGKWISSPHIYAVAFCSECGYELEINNTNYCPSCGADMRGDAE